MSITLHRKLKVEVNYVCLGREHREFANQLSGKYNNCLCIATKSKVFQNILIYKKKYSNILYFHTYALLPRLNYLKKKSSYYYHVNGNPTQLQDNGYLCDTIGIKIIEI
jgi:hypothetical protein